MEEKEALEDQKSQLLMRQEDLQAWLNLPQTQKLRLKWEQELRATESKLADLKVGDFPDVQSFAIEIVKLQERKRLRLSLVNDPVTALNIYEAQIKQVETKLR